jgi:uncharacterized membrane protein
MRKNIKKSKKSKKDKKDKHVSVTNKNNINIKITTGSKKPKSDKAHSSSYHQDRLDKHNNIQHIHILVIEHHYNYHNQNQIILKLAKHYLK